MVKKIIPEKRYRASRICRALGNPTAYEILTMLRDRKRTPEELAGILGVSVSNVSQTLRVLRNLDLVRYEVRWRSHLYWIKTTRVVKVLDSLERVVDVIERQS